MLAMDAASSEWKSPKGKGFYKLPKAGTEFTSSELIAHWKKLVEKYPIISIEDGLDEEDWEGWQEMTRELGGKVQLVGDDLFVTNTERLSKAKEEAAEIVGSATRRAAERSDEILRESSQQASAMVKKAERVIEQERIKAHKELKDEVADLSVMIASKIVERDVKPEDHERFIEDFIDKVG